ncbi:hypothetical protein Nepgr_006905 [Nepenthes gracilis]|uniref:Uncharacterized protein n=1 Tax=Nepenthes gracilis TaxID=150966 RepID=A0AAD3S5Z7_NEPGR|nr:hypothetical protein Nepgr_006905 [Nepenthes gracilis]
MHKEVRQTKEKNEWSNSNRQKFEKNAKKMACDGGANLAKMELVASDDGVCSGVVGVAQWWSYIAGATSNCCNIGGSSES